MKLLLASPKFTRVSAFASLMSFTPLALAASVATFTTLSSCASDRPTTPIPADHPASPLAREAPFHALDSQLSETGAPDRHDAVEPTSPADDALYVCPMHPDTRSTGPGRCPICGMKLEKRAPTQREPLPGARR